MILYGFISPLNLSEKPMTANLAALYAVYPEDPCEGEDVHDVPSCVFQVRDKECIHVPDTIEANRPILFDHPLYRRSCLVSAMYP